MRKFFYTLFVIGSSQVLLISLQIVRAKLVALFIGPEGVGVMGNTYAFMSTLENLCFFGFHAALLRFGSEAYAKGKQREVSQALSTTIFMHIVLSAIGVFVAFLAINQINYGLYKNLDYLWFSALAIIAAPLVIIYRDLINFFNAANDIKFIGKLTVFPALISLSSIAPCIYFLGVKGAILSIFIEAVVMFFVCFYFFKKKYSANFSIKRSLFSKQLAWKMFNYGGVFQLSVAISSIADYLVRVIVTNKLALVSVGIFNSALNMGNYLMLIQNPLYVYLYPKISSVYEDGVETRKQVGSMIRFFVIILSPIIMAIILFSDIIIKILLTDSFLAARSILLWILIARLFELLQGIIAPTIFIMRKYRIYLAVSFLFNALLVSLSVFLLGRYDLYGVAVAQSVSYCLLFVIYLFAARKVFDFNLRWKDMLPLITAIPLFFWANQLREANILTRFIPLLAMGIWLVFFIKTNEWRVLGAYAEKYLIKKNIFKTK